MATARRSASGQRHGAATPERHTNILLAILLATVTSTAIHYTHNTIAIDHYPKISWVPLGNGATQILVPSAWVVLTAIGALGFWLYQRADYGRARVCLALYSIVGLVTLGHFLSGEKPHIPTLFYVTIFTDALTGLAVLAFVHRMIVAPPSAAEIRPR